MKRLITWTGILFHFLMINGQVNTEFAKGFIIKNNDTIYGEFKLKPYSDMSSKVQFKENGDSVLTSYTPVDLSGFCIQPNTCFESIKFNSFKRKDTITLNYFALKIVSGDIDFLIVYLPDDTEKYFVRNKVLGLSELKQLTEIRGNQKITSDKYIITLAKYMNNNPKYQTRIRNCDFNQSSIIHLISEYNSDFGVNQLNLPPDKLKWDILMNAGIDYYLGNKIDQNHNTWGMVLGFETSAYKEKNLKTELIIGLNFRKYQYSEDLTLYKTVNSIPYPNTLNPYAIEFSRYTFGGNLIEMPVYLKYNNKTRLLSPTMELGIKPYFIQEKEELSNNFSVKTNFKFTYELILGLGIGMNYKKITAKYLVYAQPILKNSICIEYKLK